MTEYNFGIRGYIALFVSVLVAGFIAYAVWFPETIEDCILGGAFVTSIGIFIDQIVNGHAIHERYN